MQLRPCSGTFCPCLPCLTLSAPDCCPPPSQTRRTFPHRSPHTAARASALSHKKPGRKARIEHLLRRVTLPSFPNRLGPSSCIAVAVETCYTDRYKGLGRHGGGPSASTLFLNERTQGRRARRRALPRHRGGKAPVCEFSHKCSRGRRPVVQTDHRGRAPPEPADVSPVTKENFKKKEAETDVRDFSAAVNL